MNLLKHKAERRKQILKQILNLIYPPKCGICGKLNQKFLCRKCEIKLEAQSEFKIDKYQDNYFEEYSYIFRYQGMIRKIIINYKFNDKSYLYKTIVNFLLKNEKFFENFKSYDTIIPVPISKKRKRERGYNQSYLIAKEIAKHTNLTLETRTAI